LADKGCDANEPVRKKLLENNCEAVIPSKRNRLNRFAYDKELYKGRRRINQALDYKKFNPLTKGFILPYEEVNFYKGYPMKHKRIYLVRHGETTWALEGRHTGRTDIPLTGNGKQQAASIGKALAPLTFSLALVGPQKRAADTFKIANLSVKSITDPDLAEWDYGDFEGLTSKEIAVKSPGWNIFTNGAPGGETPVHMQERADRVIKTATEIEGDVVIFSSAHILRCITARWLETEIAFGRHLTLQTGSLSILGYEHANRSLLLWNEVM